MRIDKNGHQRKNALTIFQILPTNSVRKCIEISLENLYATIGAKRVKEALLGVVRMSLLQRNLDLTNLYISPRYNKRFSSAHPKLQ